jgi:hypothetical protein
MSKLKIDAATKIDYKSIAPTIKVLLTKLNLNFDLAIQRQFVWDEDRKSLLIYSLLSGYPIPFVFSRYDRATDVDHVMDGKQRLTTVRTFVLDGEPIKGPDGKVLVERDKEGKPILGADNKPLIKRHIGWALKNIPPLFFVGEDGEPFEADFNGLTFSQLPEYAQNILLAREIPITRITGMDDDEQDEFFRMTNNGMPLKSIELVRALAGHGVMSVVDNIASRPFFAKTVNISDADKRYTRQELVTQIVMLFHAQANNLSVPTIGGVALKNFANMLNKNGLDENIKIGVEQTTDYLGEALPNRETKLTKVHVHALFMVAIQAMQNDVPASKFGGYVQDFLANRVKGRYKWATESGTAKKEKVEVRLSEVIKDYETHITNAPEYVAPVPATRGRKPKAQDQGDTTPPVNQGEGETQNEQNKLVGAGASVEG